LLTVRIGPSLARALDREALRRRDTRSQVARSILEEGLRRSGPGPDPADEARRQSLLVSRRRSERETIEFVVRAADTRGWR
jgi:hypothetical protein